MLTWWLRTEQHFKLPLWPPALQVWWFAYPEVSQGLWAISLLLAAPPTSLHFSTKEKRTFQTLSVLLYALNNYSDHQAYVNCHLINLTRPIYSSLNLLIHAPKMWAETTVNSLGRALLSLVMILLNTYSRELRRGRFLKSWHLFHLLGWLAL